MISENKKIDTFNFLIIIFNCQLFNFADFPWVDFRNYGFVQIVPNTAVERAPLRRDVSTVAL